MDSVGSSYEASATSELRSALFSRACVLVEGATEALALPALLRKQGFDTLRHGIAFVSAEGIGNIAKWARLFLALGIPAYCIFDTDSNKSGADAQSLLVKRRDLLSAIEVDASQAEADGHAYGTHMGGSEVRNDGAKLRAGYECSSGHLLGQRLRRLGGDRGRAVEAIARTFCGHERSYRGRHVGSPSDHPTHGCPSGFHW